MFEESGDGLCTGVHRKCRKAAGSDQKLVASFQRRSTVRRKPREDVASKFFGAAWGKRLEAAERCVVLGILRLRGRSAFAEQPLRSG